MRESGFARGQKFYRHFGFGPQRRTKEEATEAEGGLSEKLATTEEWRRGIHGPILFGTRSGMTLTRSASEGERLTALASDVTVSEA